MGNYILIAIIAILVGSGIFSAIKHFKGDGGCCGGGSYKPKKKRLSCVKYKKTFKVDGMHCEHCKRRVEEAVNDIKGVAGRVNLRRGELTVSYAEDVEDEFIRAKIEKAGYNLKDITR